MYVSEIGIIADGISCYLIHYSMHINLIKPTASYDGAMLNEKGMIPNVKGRFSNPWGPLGVFHVSTTMLFYCCIVLLLVGGIYLLVGKTTTTLTPALPPKHAS